MALFDAKCEQRDRAAWHGTETIHTTREEIAAMNINIIHRFHLTH